VRACPLGRPYASGRGQSFRRIADGVPMIADRLCVPWQQMATDGLNGMCKMRSRSINIFLLDGEPDGIRVAQISMSTIQAIAFRRLQLKRVRGTFPEELSRAGVYLLLGFDETQQPDRQIAYIGESECVGDRLQHHASNDKGNESKMFWVDTIVMVSKDENLTPIQVRSATR
jgi:hypothetical protein